MLDNVMAEKALWVFKILGVRVGEEKQRSVADFIGEAEARLYKELDAGADRPTAIMDKVAYVTSELNGLRGQVARQVPAPEQPALLRRIDDMQQTISATVAAGMRRAVTAIGKDVTAAQTALNSALSSGDDRKKAYALASEGSVAATKAENDWTAQVKAGRGLAGIGDLAQPLRELSEARANLDSSLGDLLPPVRSVISSQPQGAAAKPDKKDQVTDPAKALEECGKSWPKAKELYGRFPTEMQKLADHRKAIVDKWLKDTLTPYGLTEGTGTGWVAVGSTDPTSDYDISVNKHGQKDGKTLYDYEIVKMFNAHFRKLFGCETGTIFDTNLYCSAKMTLPPLPKDGTPAEMQAADELVGSADIGALMKQRRYMSQPEFNAYRDDVLAGLVDPVRAKTLSRFEMAEANYQISQQTTIDTMRRLIKQAGADGAKLSPDYQKAAELIEEYDRGNGDAGGTDMIAAAGRMEALAHDLEHKCKDASTMATNEIYADATGQLRTAETQLVDFSTVRKQVEDLVKAMESGENPVAAAKQMAALADTVDGFKPSAAEKLRRGDFAGAASDLADKSADLISDLARAESLSMFFANEAYQSGGPFKHVVYAGQAVETDLKNTAPGWAQKSDEEKKQAVAAETKKRRDELTGNERLESFNEQLGDFLKDLAHYGDEDAGVAIIQSSKYLDRLVDAAALLNEKKLLDDAGSLKSQVATEISHQKDIRDQLIAARKGKLVMEPVNENEPIDQAAERRAFACDFMKRLGITSVAALGQTYSNLGKSVNIAVRKKLAA